MEYCCHIWAGAPSCYLELLDKLQKRICKTVGPSLATALEPLAHHQNVANLSLFYRYYFGRCSSELAQLAPLPFSRGRSTRYSDRLHYFFVTIPVNRFFPCTARPWNSECECDKTCNIGEYLDYENCKSKKKLVDQLVNECTETIEEVKLAKITLAENESENKYSSS